MIQDSCQEGIFCGAGRKIIPDTSNPDNQGRIHFREVMRVNIEKIMEVLIGLLAEQEGVKIEYTIEKPA